MVGNKSYNSMAVKESHTNQVTIATEDSPKSSRNLLSFSSVSKQTAGWGFFIENERGFPFSSLLQVD